MIIKTETGWRNWQQCVINLDGHAVPDGTSPAIAIAPKRSAHWMLLAREWGSYLRLASPAETLEELRSFWTKTVLKVNNGTTKRLPDGRLIVKMYASTVVI